MRALPDFSGPAAWQGPRSQIIVTLELHSVSSPNLLEEFAQSGNAELLV